MTKETKQLTEQIADFGAGEAAYYDSRGDLYFEGTPAFREGYKNAFYENERLPGWKDPDGVWTDRAWDAHVEEMDYARAFTPEPSGVIAKNTIQSFIVGFCAAIGFVLVALGPFLMDADEVAKFWTSEF